MNEIRDALTSLEIPENAQLIYVSLLTDGTATALTLARRTNISRPSVYDQIKTLTAKKLVAEIARDGTTLFSVTDPLEVERLLTEKMEMLAVEKEAFLEKAPTLFKDAEVESPRIRFFEGADGMKKVFKDILWHDEITLSILWSYEHMLALLGEEYLDWFNDRRIKNDIDVCTIWPVETKKLKSHIFIGKDIGVEKKYLKDFPSPTMSYIIYGKKTIFFSSSAEAFGFVVDSKEHAEMMQMQFKALWANAKK